MRAGCAERCACVCVCARAHRRVRRKDSVANGRRRERAGPSEDDCAGLGLGFRVQEVWIGRTTRESLKGFRV